VAELRPLSGVVRGVQSWYGVEVALRMSANWRVPVACVCIDPKVHQRQIEFNMKKSSLAGVYKN